MLVILFNIIAPAGWQVGLLRVEDVAIGCAVSLVVGLLFWPRGAAAALNRALSDAYTDSAEFLARAVEFGMVRCDVSAASLPPPSHEAVRAAAASRRLDDTFRAYLAERGAKPVPLAEVSSLVTGVAGLRLAADAVLDLWQREDGQAPGDRAGARGELLGSSEAVRSLVRRTSRPASSPAASVRDPLQHDLAADGRSGRRRAHRPAAGGRSGQRHRRPDDLDRRPPRRGPAVAGHPRRAGAGRQLTRRRASCWLVSVAWTMP